MPFHHFVYLGNEKLEQVSFPFRFHVKVEMVVDWIFFIEDQLRDSPQKTELKADDENRVTTHSQAFLLDRRVLVDVVPGGVTSKVFKSTHESLFQM